MFDIRFYNRGNIYFDKGASELMDGTFPDDKRANGYEVIAGKVVKFLLTEKGSDAFNPSYGGISMHHRQISQSYLPQIRLEISADIDACTKFIKNEEIQRNVVGERLSYIKLLKVVYNPRLSPTRLDVYIDIYTTAGNHAIVAIKGLKHA